MNKVTTKVLCTLVLAVFVVGEASAAKNVILLIGDGMSLQHIGMALSQDKARKRIQPSVFQRLLASLPYGLLKTNSLEFVVTESGAAATAMACGKKTLPEVIGKDGQGKVMPSILEIAQQRGKATGVISTHRITDATPAAFYAHVNNRNHHSEIAGQLVDSKVDVVLGGGLKYFIGKGDKISERYPVVKAEDSRDDLSGRRDERRLIEEIELAGGRVVTTAEELALVDGKLDGRLFGLFAAHDMALDIDRQTFDQWQPTLRAMTKKAIDLLAERQDGFFLMVEGASIDSASHYNDAAAMLGELRAFGEAVDAAIDFAKRDGDTLVIVTADHETACPSFAYKKLRRPARTRTFVDGFTWQEKYDHVPFEATLLLDRQRASFKRMLIRARREPAALTAEMNRYTPYDFELTDAKWVLEPMPARGAPPARDPYYEFHSASTIFYCGRLHRFLAGQTYVAWGTGHHGGGPVPVIGYGPAAEAVRGLHDNTWIHHFLKRQLQ